MAHLYADHSPSSRSPKFANIIPIALTMKYTAPFCVVYGQIPTMSPHAHTAEGIEKEDVRRVLLRCDFYFYFIYSPTTIRQNGPRTTCEDTARIKFVATFVSCPSFAEWYNCTVLHCTGRALLTCREQETALSQLSGVWKKNNEGNETSLEQEG